MKTPLTYLLLVVTTLLYMPLLADDILQQWRDGLSGARLTAYSGSVISNNSTLTVLNLCRNGRYSYYREGSWNVPGTAGGASNNTITGRWSVIMNGANALLQYATDQGQQGNFPMYLQGNGKVNIGGVAYTVQTGGAGC